MAQAAKVSRITSGYVEIKKLIESLSYSKIIKAANKILNDDPQQVEAWQCKVVALIQTDQFSDASIAIIKSPCTQDMQFELAYCQYRLNRAESSLQALERATDKDSPRGKELRAQILYRLEQYGDCYTVYRDLVRSTADDLDMERTTNMTAVQVHRAAKGECPAPSPPASNASYEHCYNNACACVAACEARGDGETLDAAQGLIRLQEAMERCRRLLQEEGAGEDEVQQEQAIIRVQRGYTLQVMGRDKEALVDYSAVLQHPNDDVALTAILHNNLATINRDGNVFDSRKKMKATLVPELQHKLTSVQRNQLTLNNCILAYSSQQSQQEDATIERECGALATEASATIRHSAVLLLAASLARAGKLDQAKEELAKWATEQPQHETAAKLTMAQLQLMKSDVSGGLTSLSSLPVADRHRPGVVASVVTLLMAKKQTKAIAQVFKEAATYYQNNESSGVTAASVEQVLRRASDHLLKEGDSRAAAAALQQLRDIVGDACLPALINAYSQFDPAKAQELSRTVSLPSDLLASLDADSLEASLGPKYFLKAAMKMDDNKENSPAAAAVLAAEKQKAEGGSGRVKPRKKKKRKTVLPKSYVKGETPDPERWLPRWQRKNIGRRRRDKRKEKEGVGRGTQGGVGDATDKYDITKNPGQYKSSSLHQQPEPAGPRRNMPKRRNKKK